MVWFGSIWRKERVSTFWKSPLNLPLFNVLFSQTGSSGDCFPNWQPLWHNLGLSYCDWQALPYLAKGHYRKWKYNFATGKKLSHLKTHRGEKSNKCNQCDFASIQTGNLRTLLIVLQSYDSEEIFKMLIFSVFSISLKEMEKTEKLRETFYLKIIKKWRKGESVFNLKREFWMKERWKCF